MSATALIVTSDSALANRVREAVLHVADLEFETASQFEHAHCLEGQGPAIVFYHVTDCGGGGVKPLLERAKSLPLVPAVVTISDDFQPTQAVSLLKQGATDCLSRPLDLGRLAMLTDFLTWRTRTLKQFQPVETLASDSTSSDEEPFLFWPKEMTSIADQVRALAPLQTTVLLTGETGTGKTRLARMLHEESPRCDKPFIVVNCGTLTPTLAESELFGHVQSAFTGADQKRAGKFGAAADGTLLLDDIDALSPDLQAKLLRAVDERCYEPVGSDTTQPLRARIIVATNRCLEDEVKAGRFRHDLLYRINVVTIHLPMLRDRREMIAPLVEKWIGRFSRQNGRAAPTIEPDAMAALAAYHWPGNLRELRNVVEQVVALCGVGNISLDCLPDAVRACAPAPLPKEARADQSQLVSSRQQAEYTVISQALAKHGNNRSRTAAELGISRVTLYKKLRKYGLMLTGEIERQAAGDATS